MPYVLRSFLTTFLVVLLGVVPVAYTADWSWLPAALYAAGLASLRTLVAALDPGMPLYGNGQPEDQ